LADRASAYGHPFGQAATQVVVASLDGDVVRVDEEDARHLVKSLRLRKGDTFLATDGRGAVARLAAHAIDRHGIDAHVLARADVPAPALRIWVAAAAEGARGDWIVEKAVELGAWGFRALEGGAHGRIERWKRLARAALKQSLGAHALDLGDGGPALEFARALAARAAAESSPFAVWLAQGGAPGPLGPALPEHGDLVLVTGPPEGLEETRVTEWESLPGVSRVGLGPLRLRAETAAVTLLVSARMRALAAPSRAETA